MKKFKIYFDKDDVGNKLCQFLFQEYNKDYNDNFHWEDSETFMLAENENIKATDDYFKEILHRKGTFFDLEPSPGFVKCVKDLIEEGYEVRILTHPQWTSDHCLVEKINWVKKHLPFFDLNNLMMTKLKGEVAKENRILLDDNPENLKSWEKEGGIGVCFGTIKYSQKWEGYKVSNFEEFKDLIKKLEGEKK